MSKAPPSATMAWVNIHIVFPLLPFGLEGFIKLVATDFSLSLQTFSGSTLAMSLALLSLFVNQNLLTHTRALTSDEELQRVHGTANTFLLYAIVSIAMFAIIVLLSVLIDPAEPSKLDKALFGFK